MKHLRLVVDEPDPPYEATATPDWPPIAIPGRPGWWRHHINGKQVDLPRNDNERGTA